MTSLESKLQRFRFVVNELYLGIVLYLRLGTLYTVYQTTDNLHCVSVFVFQLNSGDVVSFWLGVVATNDEEQNVACLDMTV